MEKWEYKAVRAGEVGVGFFRSKQKAQRIEAYFNEMGRQGWEMVQFHFAAFSAGELVALMKRRRI